MLTGELVVGRNRLVSQLYVQPLLESGLTLEDSMAMLVEGVLRPN
jgi:hypothetical protein